MFERFTPGAQKSVVLAQEQARRLDHNYIGTEHLLLGLIHEGEGVAAAALERLGISLVRVQWHVEEIVGHGQEAQSGHIPFTPRAKRVLELALREALRLGHNYIGTEHLLLSLIREGEGVAAQILVKLITDLDRIRQEVMRSITDAAPASKPTPRPTPRLKLLTLDLSREVATTDVDRVVGRAREIERLTQVLARRQRNIPLLIGAPGVGKSSIITGLARAIAAGTVPAAFAGRTVRSLDLGAVFANPRHHGRFAELMTSLLTEVRRSADLVLFLDNALTLLRTQDGGAEALAFLRPVLGKPGVHVIAACTTTEYRRWTPDSGLYRLLQPVEIGEPPMDEVLEILRVVRPRLEEHHGVAIDDAALWTAATLAQEHLPGQALPGSAIDLLDEAGAQAGSRGARAKALSLALTEEFEQRIAEQRKHRDAAADTNDADLTAHHNRQLATLVRSFADHRKQDAASADHRVVETDVVNALALQSDPSHTPPGHASTQMPRPGTTAPGPAVPHDPTVWAMS
ncbi:Clp protease N-terminal domain-containing protein [Kitasatospora sp. NPDC059327]|uniref:Clp protease N-terminal domain-containing protein n=1 Tax=Kitasatospora sp. NPDC059327 TaxID=3346803 RepID=UPI0036BCA9B7